MNNKLIEILNGAKKDNSTRPSKQLEISVMKSLINEDNNIDIYQNKKGLVGQVNPRENFVNVATSILTSTGMNKDEARQTANSYQATDKEATDMVEITKTFVPAYLGGTGKKLNFHNTKEVSITLGTKEVPEVTRKFDGPLGKGQYTVPKHNKVTCKGKNIYDK